MAQINTVDASPLRLRAGDGRGTAHHLIVRMRNDDKDALSNMLSFFLQRLCPSRHKILDECLFP
jgi:hypothetical protein